MDNIMKKTMLSVIVFASLVLMSGKAWAQITSSGTLTVDATVASTINLTFVSDIAGVPLTGSGTNTATLNFGTISEFGPLSPNVTRSIVGSNLTVRTPFDISVTESNVTSDSYTLTAQLTTTDATNSWAVDAFTLNSATPTTLTAAGVYATNAPHTLALTVPAAEAAGAITNAINFVALAN
jgi:hypothetical protein